MHMHMHNMYMYNMCMCTRTLTLHLTAARSLTIIESVKKTNRLVTVEEGWPACGIGAELGDCVCESGRVLRAFGQERADGSHV